MRFGINIPNFGVATTPETLHRWAEYAEDTGFDLVTVSDHIAQTPDVISGFPGPFYDPFTTLAWLAGQTRRIRLGTSAIILPYRHPLLTARLAANIDQLCGGRLVLGVAAGWSRSEFAALGVLYPQRGRITDEILELLPQLWSGSDVGDVGGVINTPAPAAEIPIWVGGHSHRALQRAVRYGTAWHPTSVTATWIRDHALPELRGIARAHGCRVPDLAPRIKLRFTERPLPETTRRAGEGTPDQVHADLTRLADLGATDIVFDPTSIGEARPLGQDERDWTHFDRLTREVIDLGTGTLR